MKPLKIGYWPLSPKLDAAGDRRRLIFWSHERGHQIVTDTKKKVDVIVASENSDFNSNYFQSSSTPIIFDLIDAYLSPRNALEDTARGLAKRGVGKISGKLKPFSHYVRDFCQKSSAVICSSVEQEVLIRDYNENTHVILDSHDEIPFSNFANYEKELSKKKHITWEGQPATIRGLNYISPLLIEFSQKYDLGLACVTDERYFLLLNRYLERDTHRLLKDCFDDELIQLNIIPWSVANLVKSAQSSFLGIIPIDLSIPIQKFKPENRLLIMWRLGLPCLTSAAPSYVRVSSAAGVNVACRDQDEWRENLSQLMGDAKYAALQVRKGQEYLKTHHSKDVLLKKWDRVFESVMGR